MSHGTKLFKILCGAGHTVLFQRNHLPSRSELVYCPKCEKYARSWVLDTREWHVKCTACSHGSWHGEDRWSAVSKASKHKHPCNVTYEHNPSIIKDIKGSVVL